MLPLRMMAFADDDDNDGLMVLFELHQHHEICDNGTQDLKGKPQVTYLWITNSIMDLEE